ncbi:unnamed protein product [Nezara viridula]|uniref:F-box domain-containing protein n=1 Tax=Nezara viridula TaxID=85310 RepID=A0A9P0MDK5_NEZVI|nr:unnamed protein product [Nezara viridula]
MDIVGNLPQEISQHVLSFLTPTELFKCFHVCKKWYNLANTDFLWKRHCVLELLLSADTNIPLSSSNGPLCKWGSIYRSFKRKVNRWEHDCAQCFNVTLSSLNSVIAFGELSFVVYYFLPLESHLEKLYVYRLCEEKVNCEQIIELELPGRGIVQLITNDIYTLVSRDNFILCFKKTPEKHITYVAICLRSGVLEYTTEDIICFINAKSCLDRELNIRELCNSYLWFEDSSKTIHVFNLETNEFLKISPLQEMKRMCNLITTWSESEVIVYSPGGEVLLNLPIDYVQDVFLNKTTLACLHPAKGQHTRVLQTFDVKSGEKLMQKNVMRFADITLHSSYDSIYILERSSRDLYRVSSLCARTGQIQWNVSLPNMFYNLWPAILHVVSYKHLFVWPCNNRTDRYSIFNLKTGKMLYASSNTGSIQYINEGVCISVDGKVVHIKSFL